jgi:hypothetical protein
MAMLVFCQLFGGALFVTFAELAFSNGLTSGLAKYAPAVNPLTVIDAGASAFRNIIPADQLHGVLQAYVVGFEHVLYLSTASIGACLIFCWGMGWKKVHKAKPKTPELEEALP